MVSWGRLIFMIAMFCGRKKYAWELVQQHNNAGCDEYIN
jgi:hypothetical protein